MLKKELETKISMLNAKVDSLSMANRLADGKVRNVEGELGIAKTLNGLLQGQVDHIRHAIEAAAEIHCPGTLNICKPGHASRNFAPWEQQSFMVGHVDAAPAEPMPNDMLANLLEHLHALSH